MVGKIWSRRRMLAVGAAGAGWGWMRGTSLFAQEKAACTLSPELEVGPYYVNYELMRKDIREDRAGVPLHLKIVLMNSKTCLPLKDAAVDVWHCDAMGIYSGYTKNNPDSMGGPGGMLPPPPPKGAAGGPHYGPPGMKQTDQETFLRGVQITGKDGSAEFLTIYPGWYVSRDIHVHLEVHMGGKAGEKKYAGGHVCHIGQIAFPDDLSDAVAKLEPYAQHKKERTRLEDDHVFHDDLANVMLRLQQIDSSSMTKGFTGEITFWVDPDAMPKQEGPGSGGMPEQWVD
ncbi:intradiol ring-cleavage dioxygenase [Terriglobus saanensis SP1PR4]|uniref:Intradiol ring-cleavage dioxygenase n=2 Tax=Terriglobus saanensis TaxID=870903 RepID=E8V5J6_TERSS|nr:intradiol ring-cleavage dioxygenase [Terriglobus saanensis SP1PR4]